MTAVSIHCSIIAHIKITIHYLYRNPLISYCDHNKDLSSLFYYSLFIIHINLTSKVPILFVLLK